MKRLSCPCLPPLTKSRLPLKWHLMMKKKKGSLLLVVDRGPLQLMMTILDTLLNVLLKIFQLKIFLLVRPLANLRPLANPHQPRDTTFVGNVLLQPQDRRVRLKTRYTPFVGDVLLNPQASWRYSS